MLVNSWLNSLRSRRRRPVSRAGTVAPYEDIPEAPQPTRHSLQENDFKFPSKSKTLFRPSLESKGRRVSQQYTPSPDWRDIAENTQSRSPQYDENALLTFNKIQESLLHINKSPSLAEFQIPPVPSIAPMSIRNLTAAGNSSLKIGPSPKSCRQPGKQNELASLQQLTSSHSALERKSVPVAGGSPFTQCEEMRFNPQAPVYKPEMHQRAKVALRRRYQAKFTYNPGVVTIGKPNDYEFLWVLPRELDAKVLSDIIWTRERYAQARKEEPTDEEIIAFYDAERYDLKGVDAGIQIEHFENTKPLKGTDHL